jgi:RHS repeat-associated protein
MSTLERIQYGFDRNSRRTWKRRALTTNEDDHYGYDGLSQVINAARGNLNLNTTAISGRPASEELWNYDPTGNWQGYNVAANGSPVLDQSRVHDRGNRLTQIEDNPNAMILDRAGRMRQMSPDATGNWTGKLELTWDAWSRITNVRNNGTLVGSYAYDGLARRITRNIGSTLIHSYYSDAWRPLEERKTIATTASAHYLWGARHRDDLVRRDRVTSGSVFNETRYVLMDYFNPASITDASGTVTERYAFSAFGVRRILNPSFTPITNSECAFEFAFQGQFLDVESGLINYGFRYFSPHLGKWCRKDPIGIRGGLNLYSFGDNSPVNMVDLLGLCCPGERCDCKVAGRERQTNSTRSADAQAQADIQKLGGVDSLDDKITAGQTASDIGVDFVKGAASAGWKSGLKAASQGVGSGVVGLGYNLADPSADKVLSSSSETSGLLAGYYARVQDPLGNKQPFTAIVVVDYQECVRKFLLFSGYEARTERVPFQADNNDGRGLQPFPANSPPTDVE